MNMKKFLMLGLALICLAAFAAAEEPLTEATVLAVLERGEADGWRIPEVSGFVPGEFLLQADGTPYLAVNQEILVLQNEGRNVLCVIERDARGHWRLKAQNEDALYQGMDAVIPYVYCEIVDQFELYFHHMVNGERQMESYFLVRGMDGWRVTDYEDERTGMKVHLNKTLMTFYGSDYRFSYTVRTEFNNRFENFGLETIRKAVRHAETLLPEEAATPWEGYYLPDPVEGSFAKNQKLDVYAAPSADAYRAAKGKAAVSTNGGIEVYGETRGWLMIQYEVSRNQRRIGYITADALPYDTPVRSLQFGWDTARLTRTAVLTDDPFFSRNELKALEVDEEVVLLAQVDDWAYVEATMPDGRAVRGFIPIDALTTNLANG